VPSRCWSWKWSRMVRSYRDPPFSAPVRGYRALNSRGNGVL